MKTYKQIKEYYNWGGRLLTNSFQIEGRKSSQQEMKKQPSRTDVINLILSIYSIETNYLEIGVRRPEDNFNKIKSKVKYSVDPGIENPENPVDFKMTSDSFFNKLSCGEILQENILFDVVFIDGLHLADQVNRDIENALSYLKKDGFIILHDCNPPTEWHAREEFYYDLTPARNFWNGTTWKAFYKYRMDERLTSICIDTDWGVGILTRRDLFGRLQFNDNPFFEYKAFEKNRKTALNLVSFDAFKSLLGQK